MPAERHKLLKELSREELDAFLRELVATPGVDGPTIQRLAKEKFDIDIGHDSANTFRKNYFEKYLERLQKQRDTALFLAKHVEPDGASTLGTAISQWIGTELFDALNESGLVVDVTTKEGIEQAEAIARIAERLSRNDVRTRTLIKDAKDQAREEERAALAKEMDKRVGSGGGLSADAIAQIRSSLGWTPPSSEDKEKRGQGDKETAAS